MFNRVSLSSLFGLAFTPEFVISLAILTDWLSASLFLRRTCLRRDGCSRLLHLLFFASGVSMMGVRVRAAIGLFLLRLPHPLINYEFGIWSSKGRCLLVSCCWDHLSLCQCLCLSFLGFLSGFDFWLGWYFRTLSWFHGTRVHWCRCKWIRVALLDSRSVLQGVTSDFALKLFLDVFIFQHHRLPDFILVRF